MDEFRKPNSAFLKQVREDWQPFLDALKLQDEEREKLLAKELKRHHKFLGSIGGEVLEKYAVALLWLNFEEGAGHWLMLSSIWSTLFPFVRRGYEQNKMPYIKWMYQAYRFGEVREYLWHSPQDVLRKALSVEPENAQVASWLHRENLNLLQQVLLKSSDKLLVNKQRCLEVIRETEILQRQFLPLISATSNYGYTLEMLADKLDCR